jgi:hypothetical protein
MHPVDSRDFMVLIDTTWDYSIKLTHIARKNGASDEFSNFVNNYKHSEK